MSFYSEKILPVISDAMTGPLEGARNKLMAELSGDVLEIGFGSGLSLEHYPEAVRSAGPRDSSQTKVPRTTRRPAPAMARRRGMSVIRS